LKLPSPSLTAGLFALRRQTLVVAASLAACLLVAGWFAGTDTRPGVIMLGIATSVLAAVGLAWAAIDREQFAQRILDLGVQRIFHDRLTGLESTTWTDLLGDSKREFKVLGMANHGYLSTDGARAETEEALKKALDRKKVEVEFLWLNPENDLAIAREKEEGRALRRDICNSIIFFWELAEKLEEDQRPRFSMREYSTVPTCGLTWADDYMVVTHYLAGELNLRAPGVVLRNSVPKYERLFARFRGGKEPKPGLAKTYSENYREIAADRWSKPIDADRVGELRQLRDELERVPGESEAVLRQREPS
jgi:hypothetical protein